MKVYTNNRFHGHYPVGTAAVVVAVDRMHAAVALEERLIAIGLAQTVKADGMLELNIEHAGVVVLHDGEY